MKALLSATALLAGSLAVPAAAAAPEPAPAAPILAPYFTELDLTGDRQVTEADLEVVAALLGQPAPAQTPAADVDGDGTITVADLAAVSQRMIYDDGPFELVEADLVDMQGAMNAGVTTSVDITQEYLDRIAAYDRTSVPGAQAPLNSVITTNAGALEAAAQADAQRSESGFTSMLLGVPVAVKDNYNTADMPTSAGCGCWEDNQTASDAFMVGQLREDGAVILAKAAMDEFAFNFESRFSAGQPAGDYLTVVSPYATDRSAGGSSGGTGASVAANLAGLGFGTDTGGSIRVPSSYNQLVGVRPTVGLTSRDGIVPLALSQDTGGPLARSVLDAALALDTVAGVDAADAVTARQEGKVPESYTTELSADALDGARIGYVPAMVGSDPTTQRLWAQTVATLESLGATVVQVEAPVGFDAVLAEPSGSNYELRHDLAAYAQKFLSPTVQARTLPEIVASGRYVPQNLAAYQARGAITDEQYEAWAGPEGSHTLQLAAGKTLVTSMLEDGELDALAYPTANPYAPQGFNMRLSPNTGMPAVTVPIGQATEADATVTGGNVNLEFLGRDFDEGHLLGLAYALEQEVQARTTPALFGPLAP